MPDDYHVLLSRLLHALDKWYATAPDRMAEADDELWDTVTEIKRRLRVKA